MFKKLVSLIAIFGFSFVCQANGITYFDKFMTADYWMSNNPAGEVVILDAAKIGELNEKICSASRTVFNMEKFPQRVNGEYVKVKASDFDVLADELYMKGKLVSEDFKNILKTQANIDAIPKIVEPQYAVAVRRTSLRNQPTGEALFYHAQDQDFDALQDTMLEPCEPVVIMHTSSNGYFYYVQAANYCGWVSKYNLALTDRKTWLQFVVPTNFLVLQESKFVMDVDKEKVLYQMGAKIPFEKKTLQGYVIDIPKRNKNGKLVIENRTLPFDDAFSEGYLPYTTNNIVRLAMKFNGQEYGWGGLKDSVDCSGLVNCVYRTMGIFLPRNSDEQEATYGSHIEFAGIDDAQRLAVVKQLPPGTVLFMEGRCMILLGNSADCPYVIHALGSCKVDGEIKKIMQVVVSDLTLQRTNDNSYLTEITQAVQYK